MKLLKLLFKVLGNVKKAKAVIPYVYFIKKIYELFKSDFPKQDDKLNKIIKDAKKS